MGPGPIPGQRTKMPQAMHAVQPKKKIQLHIKSGDNRIMKMHLPDFYSKCSYFAIFEALSLNLLSISTPLFYFYITVKSYGPYTTSPLWNTAPETRHAPKITMIPLSHLMKVKVAQSWLLWPHGLHNLRHSPGQNTGVCSSSLLQGIFPTQGSNPGLPHYS